MSGEDVMVEPRAEHQPSCPACHSESVKGDVSHQGWWKGTCTNCGTSFWDRVAHAIRPTG